MITQLRLIRLALACSQGMSFSHSSSTAVQPNMDFPHHRSHLPLLFVGMEHIMLSNHALADEALNAAHSMCDGDPLLMNEKGVMAFSRGECVIWIVAFLHSLITDFSVKLRSCRFSIPTIFGTCPSHPKFSEVMVNHIYQPRYLLSKIEVCTHQSKFRLY
jgi:hypothetical protein